jgi:hypothetical protein
MDTIGGIGVTAPGRSLTFMGRKLRVILGESLIELGSAIRDLGGFVLPNYERHPAFSSNGDLDATVKDDFYNGTGERVEALVEDTDTVLDSMGMRRMQ